MSKLFVNIIDYGVGNVYSIGNALQRLGYRVKTSAARADIKRADALILPGVGAFAEAMQQLNERNLADVLGEEVLVNKKPILGICLGMQLLAESSEENGLHKGLGWIPGKVVKIDTALAHRVPHVGWNNIRIAADASIFSRIDNDTNFYFDHSYHFTCAPEHSAATCWYGTDITAAVHAGNIMGVQFHPEKSQTAGLKLFRGFLNAVNINA